MLDTLQTDLLTPEEAARQANTATAPNGVRYATLGRLDAPNTTPAEIHWRFQAQGAMATSPARSPRPTAR